MNAWIRELRSDLDKLESLSMRRRLTALSPKGRRVECDGETLINLAGNDYLGLSDHPHLKRAAVEAIEQFGVGAGASRLVSGNQLIHQQVERRFAEFKHAEAALITPTGLTANLAVIATLAGPGDLICLDKLSHASLIDAARASSAALRIFAHCDYDKLKRLLDRFRTSLGAVEDVENAARPSRALIVTDSVFSMDGDVADLSVICDLAQRYDAITIVDEAHGTGVLGETGAGMCELDGVVDRVDVVISTAGKALGGLGGVITAKQEIIDTLINRARSFIYTTAAPPAQAAVIGAALDVLRDEPWRRKRLAQIAFRLKNELTALGWATGSADQKAVTPIVPLIVGEAEAAVRLSDHLRGCGFFAPAIRPPTVAPHAARVRLGLRADLEDDDIDQLLGALKTWTTAHAAV